MHIEELHYMYKSSVQTTLTDRIEYSDLFTQRTPHAPAIPF